MKILYILFLIGGFYCSLFEVLDCQMEFKLFQKKYNKIYSSEIETKRRERIFCKNLVEIRKHKENKNSSFKKEINKLSDKSKWELKKMRLGVSNLNSEQLAPIISYKFIEDYKISNEAKIKEEGELNYNWKEYISPVRNQLDDCGSCYAFGTVEMVESVNQIRINKKFPGKETWLSPQEIVDCSSYYGNYGCSGGNSASALQFLKENGAILDSDYPYKDAQARCYMVKEEPILYVNKYYQVEPKNQKLLQLALEKTPIVVAINMDKLFSYSEGIFDDWSCSTSDLDHVVLLIGYGYDSILKKHYWLLKNSYGNDWGENGYFRLERKLNEETVGICGITNRAFFTTVSSEFN